MHCSICDNYNAKSKDGSNSHPVRQGEQTHDHANAGHLTAHSYTTAQDSKATPHMNSNEGVPLFVHFIRSPAFIRGSAGVCAEPC